MSDILFGQSYYLRFDRKLEAALKPYPPLGTMYAASYLRRRGYDVGMFDAMLAGSEQDWDDALVRHRPRIAVLYEDNFNYLSKMCLLRMRQAAFTMIDLARRRGCTVIVAGADATDRWASYLARGADYVVLGEGEETLGELVDWLANRSNLTLEAIRGIAYVGPAGPIQTQRRPDLREVDALPLPAWDLIDVDRYRDIWRRRHGYYSMNAVTSRGCPYHCNWCAKPIWGQRYNVRSPGNVVEELVWLKSTYHPDHLWFADDILGLKPQWIQHFADDVTASNAVIPFKSLNRADLLLKDDTIPALKRAGAETVWLGAESGSQRILDAMDKGIRVEQIYEATRRLQAVGIEVGLFLQFGYPGETRSDVDLTRKMVRDLVPDDIGISVSYPLPGTRFYEAVRTELGVKENWVDSDDLAMLYQGPFSTAFYRKLHEVVHKEFRSLRAWRDFRWPISGGVRSTAGLLRRLAGAAYHAATLPITLWQLDRLGRTPSRDNGKQVPIPLAVTVRQPDSAVGPD
jgi:anaerobic magnesium-protoporphyrin IX monomethyl ester cyclase